MARKPIDTEGGQALLAAAEWLAVEYVLDYIRPPPGRERSTTSYSVLAPLLAVRSGRALWALNAIRCRRAEDSVIEALSNNFSGFPDVDEVIGLMTAVEGARTGFSGAAISQTERKRKSKAVAAAARVIAEALGHPAIQGDLQSARYMLKEGGGKLERLPLSLSQETFESLAIVADAMVDLPKFDGQADSPSAPKLYFLRRMTLHCVGSYGRPMRSLVLALAALFFDVSDMTTNDLANFAPSGGKKRTPKSGKSYPQ